MQLTNTLLGFVMPYLQFILVSLPWMDKQGGVAYYNPTARGGSMLINAGNGYGEPMNVFLFHHCDALEALTYDPTDPNNLGYHLWT